MKSFENQACADRLMSEATSATNTSPPLTITDPEWRIEGMAEKSLYRDSTPEIKQIQSENWKSIGELAAALVAKAVR